jgi:hypothetical protein
MTRLPQFLDHMAYDLHRWIVRCGKTVRYFSNGAQLPEDPLRGHYLSPLPDIASAAEFAKRGLATATSKDLPSIEINRSAQMALLPKLIPHYKDFDWSEEPQKGRRFHLHNDMFLWSDAIFLHAMLRHFRPGRVIEAGSGFSSALMLDVDEMHLGGKTHFTFVDPHPDRLLGLLSPADLERVEIIREPVQNLPLEAFNVLEAGDLLFVDSSHVSKAGSDVNWLLFEVFPRLKPGVLLHVHDIFWPFEYPAEWIKLGRSFNEAYLLRAFLQFNRAFEIVLWVPWLVAHAADTIRGQMPHCLENTGASLWLRRC